MKLTKKQMAELQGQTITDEDGEQYFIIGNTIIHVVEHFKENGPTITELLEELILYKAREEMRKKKSTLCPSKNENKAHIAE